MSVVAMPLSADEVKLIMIARQVAWGQIEVEKKNGVITLVRESRIHKLN